MPQTAGSAARRDQVATPRGSVEEEEEEEAEAASAVAAVCVAGPA